MLTSLEIITDQGAILTLPLEDASTGYLIQDITGLDPVKATIVSSSFATQDGAYYQSSRRDTRNIVVTLGLEPDYATDSVSTLRSRLYGFFMPKSEVTLVFSSDDMDDVVINGRVESFVSPLFVKSPIATISLICFDPDFVDPNPVDLSGLSVSDLSINAINYLATVEAGFVFKLTINRTGVTNFSVINTPPDGIQRNMDFSVATAFTSGDVLTVSTIPGSKSVVLTRAGRDSSLLYALSPQSDWIQLFPGLNNFRVSAQGAGMPYTIEYFNRYGGL